LGSKLADGIRPRHVLLIAGWFLLCGADRAVHEPGGAVLVDGGLAVGAGAGAARFGLSLGVGYALVDGVVPGVRGGVVIGHEFGGDLVATLRLSLPLDSYVVPYARGELGGRYDGFGLGWTWAAGGGVLIGDPGFGVTLSIGWSFQQIHHGDRVRNANGPALGISVEL